MGVRVVRVAAVAAVVRPGEQQQQQEQLRVRRRLAGEARAVQGVDAAAGSCQGSCRQGVADAAVEAEVAAALQQQHQQQAPGLQQRDQPPAKPLPCSSPRACVRLVASCC